MTKTPEFIARLNAAVASTPNAALARVSFEGAHPFGADLVHRYALGNGLRILTLVDRSAPVASYHTWYGVGSRHERTGKTGLAHFFEHLMFRETEGLPEGEFDRRLEENGAESNAATWVDWTYYYESLPSERIGIAVELEAERMARLVLREAQVTAERDVVTNERRYRVEDDVEGAASETLYKTAFTVHPYHWPTIGWMKDIEGYTPEDCQAFYRTYYAPNNATVIVVGDIDEEAMLARIQAAYGHLPPSTIPEEDTEPEPPQLAPREVSLEKPTATEKLALAFHGPALGDAEHPFLTVLNEVLFGGRASRLYRSLVLEKELATDVRGWVSTFRDPGLYEIWLTARPGKSTAELEALVTAELQRVQREPVTEEELQRAKARLELSLLQSLETCAGKAEQIGFYETVLGDPGAAFRRLGAYRRARAGDLLRAARRYLTPRTRTAVRILPESAEVAS